MCNVSYIVRMNLRTLRLLNLSIIYLLTCCIIYLTKGGSLNLLAAVTVCLSWRHCVFIYSWQVTPRCARRHCCWPQPISPRQPAPLQHPPVTARRAWRQPVPRYRPAVCSCSPNLIFAFESVNEPSGAWQHEAKNFKTLLYIKKL